MNNAGAALLQGFAGNVWNIKRIFVPFLYADHPAAVRYAHRTSAHDSGCLVDETAYA